jgi:glycosyltransferase involved in cell wall biosynthesis
VTHTFGRYLNPLARVTWRRASLILVQNAETREWLPAGHRPKTRVLSNAVLEESLGPTMKRHRDSTPTALFAGRLLPLKGVSLAIQALEHLPEWRLVICGEGPDESRLRRLAARIGVQDRVRFLGWIPRSEVLRLMREEADAFVFPSLHDEGPWSVVEAVASGLPVVSLDRGGAVVLASSTVKPDGVFVTSRRLAQAVRAVYGTNVAVPRIDIESTRSRVAELLRAMGLDKAGSETDRGDQPVG